jgi:hypothetical protein
MFDLKAKVDYIVHFYMSQNKNPVFLIMLQYLLTIINKKFYKRDSYL